MESLCRESTHHKPSAQNDAQRAYVVFRRDDLTPAEAGRKRASLEGRGYVAVRVHSDGDDTRGAVIYFDSATAQPPLSGQTLDAVFRAFVDAVSRDPYTQEPLVCETDTGCYAFISHSELAAHRLAQNVVRITHGISAAQ